MNKAPARPKEQSQLRAYRALSWAGHGLSDSFFFLLPPILPVILQELGIRLTSAGLLVSAFLFIVAISAFLSGRISDRLPAWRIIAGGFLLASAGIVAASFVSSLVALLGFFILAGIGVGTFHPAALAQFDHLAFRRTGQAFGVFEFWGSVTLVAMVFINGTLLGSLGWQGVLRLTGLLGAALAGLYLWRYRRQPFRSIPGPSSQERTGTPNASRTVFLLFLLSSALRFLSVTAILNFTPTYLVLERGLRASLAAYASAFIFIGGAILCPLLGRAADRIGALRTLLLITALIWPLILLFSFPLPLWVTPVLLIFLGGFISGSAPAQNLFLSRIGSKLGVGARFGFLMGLIALIASTSPFLFGFLADRIGMVRTLRLFVLPAVLSLALMAWLARLEAKKR